MPRRFYAVVSRREIYYQGGKKNETVIPFYDWPLTNDNARGLTSVPLLP